MDNKYIKFHNKLPEIWLAKRTRRILKFPRPSALFSLKMMFHAIESQNRRSSLLALMDNLEKSDS